MIDPKTKGTKVPPPALPPNENERLESLRALHLLDTPLEERFDRITRIAKKTMNTPIAVISLVDKERQWFKSIQGLGDIETARAVSFCGHAILRNETMVVTDATRDTRVFDSPLVTGPPHIRFYMGQPIRSPQNMNIGVLCHRHQTA
jgi:GAF domain-containing protein